MDALGLLAEARRAGLVVRFEAGVLVVDGPRRLEPLARALLAAKPGVLAALATYCARCGAAGTRLVVSYWGPAYCASCCPEVAAEHDEHGTWPPVPWDEERGGPA